MMNSKPKLKGFAAARRSTAPLPSKPVSERYQVPGVWECNSFLLRRMKPLKPCRRRLLLLLLMQLEVDKNKLPLRRHCFARGKPLGMMGVYNCVIYGPASNVRSFASICVWWCMMQWAHCARYLGHNRCTPVEYDRDSSNSSTTCTAVIIVVSNVWFMSLILSLTLAII